MLDRWPVIVAIILGSIIVLSVVLCIARCICCGAELACCCFKCCTCCCPSGGRRGHKRVKTPPPRPYDNSSYAAAPPAAPLPPQSFNQPYRSHAPPTFTPAPAPTFNPAPAAPAAPAYRAAPKPEAPQFARFDAHAQPVNEDALPAMPSWKDAKSVHVEEDVVPEKRDDVEMDRLDHNGGMTGTSVAAVAAGGPARRSPGPGRSPVQRLQTEQSYGHPQGYENDAYANRSPHHSPQSNPGGYGAPYGQQQDAYRGVSPSQSSLPPAYGAAAGAGHHENQYNPSSPGPGGYNGQPPARRSPGPSYDQYGHHDQYASQQHYAQPNQSRTPPPLNTNSYGYGSANRYQEPMDVSPVAPGNTMYNTGYAQAPAPAPMRDPSPVYAPSGSTRFEPPAPSASPAPAYPGQQTYNTAETSAYPGQQQQPYRAYTPAQTQGQSVQRKPLEGSWKEV